ncbi:unnamed protein product [Bubo scandiacus]
MVASNVLVALARSHFHFVMAELQSNLKAMGKVPDEIVLLTLGKMAHSYALRCIPFVRMTMLALHTMLNPVGSGRILRAVCSVLEQWSKAVNTYFCKREQCPFPGKGVAQFCEAIYPVFRYVVVNWLECTGEEDKQAVLRAVAAMMGVLLREEQHREHAWEQLPWLLHQYHQVLDTFWVSKVRCCAGPGVAAGVGLCECHELPADAECDFLPAARMCPEQTAVTLHSLLSAQLPAPQVLLSRLLVVAAAPYTKREHAVAALQLLQTLHGRIHRALGAAWETEIPLLLQYLQGRTESTLHSAEWKHRVLQFLRASLEPIEDQTWTVGLSQELSQQLGSSAPRSWEKLFLYKALGTALAACRDLRHVQGQVLRFLQETNPVELSEAQGMVSVVSYAAESHFHLVLDTVTMFSAAFTRDGFYQTSTGLEVQRGQNMESAQATCAALMRTYSGIALRAPKEQLLTRVDREILGSILQLSRAKQRDLVLKMALVESITEVSCAIQAVGDCGTFELSLKQEAMQTLLDWIKGEPWDSLVYGVFHVLEELSKLRPPLSREENRNLLSVCCQSALSYPSKEQMEKGRRTGRAAVNVQILNRRNMEDLGHLIETLLETEATSACFDDVVLVLKGWLTSAKEWERERALWVCAHVLGTCKERCELLRGGPCKQLGSLVGLLGFLTTDYLAMSRQRAWVCLGYLLQMQAKTMKVVPQADEIGSLCEKLNSPDTETSLEACTKIRKAVCKCIPPAQATDFLTANLDSLLHVTPIRARVWWEWVFAFLVESRKEILQEVPQILNTLCTYYMWQSTHRPFLLHAVFLLAHFHREPVISSLLQKGLPMDSDTVTVWRSLGGEIFGIQILRCLVEKLSRAGNDPLGTDSSACEGHSPQTALETVTITFAISEVVLALRSTEELRQLLPHLLPCLLRWASETLGEERLLSPRSSYKQLFLTGRVLEQKPCRIFLSAIELVLGRCMAQKWMRLLMRWAVWACLEDPLAHPEGVSLLSSEVTMAVFWISLPGAGAAPVAHGTARREQCVHPGDPAAMKRMMKVLRALCPCVGSQFSPARPEKGGRATGTVPADFMTFVDVRTSLLKRLQDHEGDRVETYRELEIVLHGNNSFLTSGAVNRLIAEASRDMRAAQGVTCEVKMVASNVLVALARSHFHFVMAELQSNLKAMGKVPDEIVLLTLGKMAHSYALRCIPFVRMTMLALHTMLNPVGSGRILRAVCSVLEQWSKAVNTYFCKREQCPFPGKGVAQFCEAIYPVFRYVVVNWLECTGEEDKQAVLGAVAAMMGVLLREEQHREHAWEQLPWLLHQYHQVLDTFWVSKSLCYVLEVLEGVQTPIPEGTALAIRTAVHRQLSDVTPQPGPAHQAVLTRCMVLQARMCPEQTAVTLHSLLSGGSEAGRMAALGLLGALAHSDGQARALPWPLEMAAQQGRCSKLSNTSRVVGERAGWCAQELCVPMLFCLSSASAVTLQLLSALSPGWGHRRCEGDGTARARHLTQPFFLSAAQLPAPQVLLSRLLVVAAAPYTKREHAVAALQLLQTLHGRIHRALGAAWETEIPLLLQYLQGRTESTLHSAEWKHRVLQFLRASLEPIEDQTWTVGLSQELSQQLGSSAPRSWEKLFLYKALGTALAACRDLRHVQGQVLRFLQETNPVELSEAQGMVSVVSYAAESHFHLVLDTVTMFSAAFTRDGFYQTSMGLEVQRGQNMESAQATCAALMRTYSGIALRAPKEQLLTRVDREILGSILQLSRAKQRDLVLKMALVESITEVSCAIQAVGDCGTFELSLKQEAMQTLLDWIKGEPWDSLVYGVFHVLEELSKLRPPLSREENRNLLSVCCQSALSYPSKEQMEKGRRTGRAAVNVQILNRRNMEDLGHLIETLLETEATSACFDDVVLVLKGWLTSAKEWERERALWVCAHVLGTCKERCELLRGGPCKQLGSLVGLLGFLTTDYLAMSRQRAWVCLGYLLQMQAKTMKVVPQADEIGSLCEKLNSPDTETSLEACTKIRKAVCKCIPPAQATDFLTANLDSLLHVTPIRARVWWEWVFAFLVESRKEILQEVPQILNTLCTYYMWQSTHRPFLLHAVFLLAHFHREPVISSLLQKGLPMDSDTVTVWRSLGGEIFGIQILRCLVEKLSRAGNDPLGTDSSACEGHSPQTALETVTITFAISEVVLALRSTEELRQLLPHLLPCLLRWASETLGEERLLSPRSSYKQLFLTGRVLEQKPCRIFLSAIELVLGRCMAQKWMRLLMRWAVWACLEDPLAHPEGVSLLSR